MSKKIIHYHRKGNECTFPKEDFSDEEFDVEYVADTLKEEVENIRKYVR